MGDSTLRRVLLTGDTVGGVWTFTLELAELLIAEGIDVCLATFGRMGSAAQREEAAAIPGLEWLDSSFKLEWMDDPWNDVERSGCWLLDVEKRFKPDVIHLNTLCHGALDWNAPVVVTVHSCVVSWWAAVKRVPLPNSWNRYRSEVKRSLKCADLVTAPSQPMLASVRENYGLDLACSRAISNARKATQFRIEPKHPFVLAAGRLWDEAKNIQALTEIAPRLPWPVFLAGDHQSPDGEVARLRGCSLLGQLSTADLASWFARAAIYALPARYEPFGLSALEAALSGCALVLGDIPSLREVWQDAAVFVPPDKPELLEAALRGLIEDPAHRERMARLAVSRARHYTPARMAAEYLESYEIARRCAGERRLACAS
ncbi:MAG: glycosyl transferase, group 1 [Bryobacterales bacterium]|nr:glycosyl transferase, group 1 [Bryobacterales bacterium]